MKGTLSQPEQAQYFPSVAALAQLRGGVYGEVLGCFTAFSDNTIPSPPLHPLHLSVEEAESRRYKQR